MGPRVMRRPPKFVQGFIDRHGKPRFYFRRPSFKRLALPGLPWSPEFMAAYQQALAGQPLQIGSARTKPGTVRALAVSYFNSPDFRLLRPSSQAIYRGIIDRFCTQYGDNRIANLRREHVVKLIATWAERPGAANNLRKVLRAMMRHAVEIGLRTDDPTRDLRAIRVKSAGTMTRSRNSRSVTRRGLPRAWRSPFCCIPASGDPTLCGWARSISATGY
jgi:hypothetical protein